MTSECESIDRMSAKAIKSCCFFFGNSSAEAINLVAAVVVVCVCVVVLRMFQNFATVLPGAMFTSVSLIERGLFKELWCYSAGWFSRYSVL